MKTDTPPNNNNITWHNGFVSREDREKLHSHKGAVVWLTGFSASGKSTIAHHLEKSSTRRAVQLTCLTGTMSGMASAAISAFHYGTGLKTFDGLVKW